MQTCNTCDAKYVVIYLTLLLLLRLGKLNNASTAPCSVFFFGSLFLSNASKLSKSNTLCQRYSHESSGTLNLLDMAEHKGTPQVMHPFVVVELIRCFNIELHKMHRTPFFLKLSEFACT